MYIPDNISNNILNVYHTTNLIKPNRLIKSEDLTNWCANIVKTLKQQCLNTIINNWEEHQIINEFALDEDARYVLDNLPTDLPFKLTFQNIYDDLYWKRAFKQRWAGKILPTKPVRLDYDIPNQFQRSGRKVFVEIEQNIIIFNTWKCFYIERHFQDVLEHLKPENYDAEEMKELIELSRDYIIRLKLNQLQAPADHNHERIPLHVVLPALNNLKQLNICFKQNYAGDDFSWHILQTSDKEIKNLGKGLEKCDLNILRIINTDITCDKVTILACHLSSNKNLRVLDFSHCKIGDKGTIALCKLLYELPNLVELNLMNNFIESKGLEFLSFTLSKPDIKLKQLNLNLNTFDKVGVNFLARMLVENTQLVKLNLSASGLTINNVELLIKAFETNSTLFHLDLSNNSLNEDTGNKFISLLKTSNNSLRSLDLRMTCIPSNIAFIIDEILEDRQRKLRLGVKYGNNLSFKDSSNSNSHQTNQTNEITKNVTKETGEINQTNKTNEAERNETTVTNKTNESESTNNKTTAISNIFPVFHNIEDLEAQIENIFDFYIDTLKQELSICCDKYQNETEIINSEDTHAETTQESPVEEIVVKEIAIEEDKEE